MDAIGYLTDYYKRIYADTYHVVERDPWTYFVPTDQQHLTPDQGWKLHISTDLSVLASAIALIGDRLCHEKNYWKACINLNTARALCSVPTPLSQVGKLITIYPRNEPHAQELLSWLYPLLKKFPGPVIPSDIQFRPDAPIYLRYGSFTRRQMYDLKTAVQTPYLLRPDGQKVPDGRTIGVSHPEWQPLLRSLVPEPEPSAVATNQQDAVRGLFGRDIYVIRALRQSAKGGVYMCQFKGRSVVLKEGRHGTTPDMQGRDSLARLKNEHACLQHLLATQLVPEPYDLFHEEDNIYLLMEYIEGQSLRSMVESWNYSGHDDPASIRTLCEDLVQLVRTVHLQGVRIRDLTPNNVIVTPSGCRLIDLELAFLINGNEHPFHGQTFGYVPVGHETTPRVAESYDYYALGKVILFILLGFDVVNSRDPLTLGRLNKYPGLKDLLDQALVWVLSFEGPANVATNLLVDIPPGENHRNLARKLLDEATWAEDLWPSYTNTIYSPICVYSGATGVSWFLF